jgi:hypothetical protein
MHFDPEKSLFDLPAVRWIAGAFGMAALFSAVTISLHTHLSFALDGESFNHAVDLFKVPLGILAVGLTLIGICGANHRSEQTKRQIERTSRQIAMTQNQNDFSNYYKHIEEFVDYCEKHVKSGYIASAPRKLHSQLFPSARQGDFNIDKAFLTYLENQIQMFVDICDGFKVPTNQEFTALAVVRHEAKIESNLNLKRAEPRSGSIFNAGDTSFSLSGESLNGVIRTYSAIFFAIDELLQFDLDYQRPALLKMLRNIDYSAIPSTSFKESFTFDIKAVMAASAARSLTPDPLDWQ